VPCTHEETDMCTTFANGATAVFGGTDDARHCASLLGDSMAGGIAVVDESQSQPALIEELVVDVLEPMLSEVTVDKPTPGRLVISGTVPEVPAGFFYDTYKTNDGIEGSPWRCMTWSRFDNPHMLRNRELLDKYLLKYNLTEDDPGVQRRWFGADRFDPKATAYRWRPVNSWLWTPAPWAEPLVFPVGEDGKGESSFLVAIPPVGCDTFAIGIDPGAVHRFAIVMWGWGRFSNKLWQVAEWVAPEHSGCTESQYMAVVQALLDHYQTCIGIWIDHGSAKIVNDTIQHTYSLVVKPVTKSAGTLKASADRFSDLLGQSRAHVLVGSALERDVKLAKWSKDARKLGRWAWSSEHHPDVGDAGRYGLYSYTDFSVPEAVPLTPEQQHEVLFRDSFKPPQPAYGPPQDGALESVVGSGVPGYGGDFNN
jgi:hypothetical protein